MVIIGVEGVEKVEGVEEVAGRQYSAFSIQH
jgi:hypothetical protein